MDRPNMFEQFKNKTLPEQIQKHIECSANYAKSNNEYWFKAGFLVGLKLKEIRKVQGIEEK